MPTNCLIVGVDLAPIKPIPRAITFQSDITTDKCRSTIRQHLKTWKADTVLHDGAPNVGIAWVQDAFSQAELALQALKLATEFLTEGGTFVTKLFRSKDYNALLWVCNQLFEKVEATKPPSSRNVSAEIFVVCRRFKAPKRIDPRLLDPRSVFAELSEAPPNNEAKVFNPEKKKRKRQGYEEGDHIQFKEAPVSEFVQTADPIAMLGILNRLSFRQPPNGDIALTTLDKLPETTREVRDCCGDLKVLGRKEFRLLLRWRLKARDIFGFRTKHRGAQENEDEEIMEVTPMDEELKIQEELQRIDEKESSRKKREKRRDNERKQKEIIRMQMHMLAPTEIGLEQAGPNGEDSMFALAAVDRASEPERVAGDGMALPILAQDLASEDTSDEEEFDHEEDQLDQELDMLYSQYQERKSASDARHRAKKARNEPQDGDWEGFSDHEHSDVERFEEGSKSDYESESVEDHEEHEYQITQRAGPGLGTTDQGLTKKAAMFFDQDIFKGIGDIVRDEEDSGIDIGSDNGNLVAVDATTLHSDQTSANRSLPTFTRTDKLNDHRLGASAFRVPEHPTFVSRKQLERDENLDSQQGETEVVRAPREDDWYRPDEPMKQGHIGKYPLVCVCFYPEVNRDLVLDIDIITAEAMTLAQQLAIGDKTKYDLMDEGFNKYTFQDRDGLPEWFLDDEGKHSKPHRPISAAGAAAIKEKLRALNARPIKKVREAKDRKKFRAAQRLEKLRKRSASMVDDAEISEKDKAQNIAKLMSKATKKKPRQQVKLVVARGGNRGISGRPRGVKGKYKIVDARLKKDVRADKRLAKKRR